MAAIAGFTILFSGLLLLPGFLVTTLLDIRRQQFLYCISFSLAGFAASVTVARFFHLAPVSTLVGYGIVCMLLAIYLLFIQKIKVAQQITLLRSAIADRSWLIGLVCVATVYGVWAIIVGPYTEVPADIYYHLEFAQRHLALIEQGSFGPSLDLGAILAQRSGYWYALIALTTHVMQLSFVDVLSVLNIVNGMVFISAIYVFSHRLLTPLFESRNQISVAATLVCFFIVIQMGVSVFAFIRYYTLAPVITNFVVYLAAMVCVMNLLGLHDASLSQKQKHAIKVEYGILYGCFLIALIMHNQEGLFILVMCVSTVIWLLANRILTRINSRWTRLLVLVVVPAAALLVAAIVLRLFFDSPVLTNASDPKVIALANPFVSWYPLYILNPYYQFFQVITIWGMLAVLIFFVKFNWFRKQPLLVAGMLSPLITIFNPVFVDVYLRIEGDLSLWRLCWLIPVYYIAAAFIVENVMKWKSYGALKRNLMACIVAAFFVIPTSNSISEQINPHLRTTLSATNAANGYNHWGDLFLALKKIEPAHNILTDPVTGYMIAALTEHRTFRRKFHASTIYNMNSFVLDDYSHNPLSRYRDWLLVINQRDGSRSLTGAVSNHWPEKILQISQHYPQRLLDHLQSNPQHFQKIWITEGVSIYKIKY